MNNKRAGSARKKFNFFRKRVINVMRIGVPTEIKKHEYRVALLPEGARQLNQRGHTVMVQSGAGDGCGIANQQYEAAGATIVNDRDQLWADSEMVVKVKEPLEEEFHLMREGQILFTFFHFAASRELTNAVIRSRSVAIAYETMERRDGTLPVLLPMSEVAGRMAVQEGARCLEKPFGGRGILMGGIPGVKPARVTVLGGGVVGAHAAQIASGMGAYTTILDIHLPRLRYLEEIMPENVQTLFSDASTIEASVAEADMVIGAVLKKGARAPHLISRRMLSSLKPGVVLVDVSIDQGGCFESSHPTTHDDPVFIDEFALHYCVANIPGAVPLTSTPGLCNTTLPFVLAIAESGWKAAAADSPEIRSGINIVDGQVVYSGVADTFALSHIPIDSLL
ncbi:MAG: alanine dehydrogenase [Balneolaceae bacterium]